MPEYLPMSTLSPALMSSGSACRLSSTLPVPTAIDLGLQRLLLGGVGDDDPAHLLLGLLDPPHQYAVAERLHLRHRPSSCPLRE